jgi:hypothetical protein
MVKLFMESVSMAVTRQPRTPLFFRQLIIMSGIGKKNSTCYLFALMGPFLESKSHEGRTMALNAEDASFGIQEPSDGSLE